MATSVESSGCPDLPPSLPLPTLPPLGPDCLNPMGFGATAESPAVSDSDDSVDPPVEANVAAEKPVSVEVTEPAEQAEPAEQTEAQTEGSKDATVAESPVKSVEANDSPEAAVQEESPEQASLETRVERIEAALAGISCK